MPEVWQLARTDIGLRCWEDGCIAYQPLTGETHMLTLKAGQMLGLLRENQRTKQELIAELGKEGDLSDFTETLTTWLLQLSEARLICRYPA